MMVVLAHAGTVVVSNPPPMSDADMLDLLSIVLAYEGGTMRMDVCELWGHQEFIPVQVCYRLGDMPRDDAVQRIGKALISGDYMRADGPADVPRVPDVSIAAVMLVGRHLIRDMPPECRPQ